jgi:hypothetical protein
VKSRKKPRGKSGKNVEMPMLEITQSEYARRRGVTPQAVWKLINSGRIPVVTVRGRRMIDPEAADRALADGQERVVQGGILDPAPKAPPAGQDAPGSAPAQTGLSKAKAETERYRAGLARLEYERQLGKLLDADDVLRAEVLCAEVIVREVNRLPQLADDIAAAFTRGGVQGLRAYLKETSRRLREAVAFNMRLVDGKGPNREPS